MQEADLILLNARVITLNAKQPRAKGIAIQDGTIIAVGTDKNICRHKAEHTRIIDLEGKTIIPGLVDCHVHMRDFGLFLQEVDLRNATSIKEIQEKLSEHANRHPELEWITGGRWDHEKLADKRYPTRWDLDKAVASKPVLLTRVCGHLSVANSKALQLAGITRNTRTRAGQVDLDGNTLEPTGILRDNASGIVWKVIPKPDKTKIEKACRSACQKAVETGLTEVHWLVESAQEIRVLQEMCSREELPLRVYMGIKDTLLQDITRLGLLTGFGNDTLKIGFIKILADGSLGAHTAAMKKPYADNPKKRGLILYPQRKLFQTMMKAHQEGLQIAVHAIGDRAIENVLNAYEKVLKKVPKRNHRHRIEHCSILNPKLIARMKKSGLIASVQPHFVISDFWTGDRLGTRRARWAYPFKSLLQERVLTASGSDCPVEDINPLLGVWAAVTRRDKIEERLTVKEALETYTINAAYASFDEKRKGTIEEGKFADLTILSDDPNCVAPEEIRDIKVEMVIVDGRVVYDNGQSKD